MKNLLAFGDSNTWGMVPGSKPAKRYPLNLRWTGILQSQCTDICVIEEGLCGRTTAFDDPLVPGRNGAAALSYILKKYPFIDAAVIMLGTNDCKSVFNNTAEEIGEGIELCLDILEKNIPAKNILLVSPILLGVNVWKPDKDPEFSKISVEVCRDLKKVYREIAEKRGTAFLAASDYTVANQADEEHMDSEGHKKFALAICSKLKEMKVV